MSLSWPEEWHGDTPVCLMVIRKLASEDEEEGSSQHVLVIDLDEHEWKETYSFIFTEPAEWHLLKKDDKAAVLSMHVLEGNQPYYVARVIGNVTGPNAGKQTHVYGIGKKAKRFSKKKKRWLWNEDNLWWLQWGQVCGGTDVELFTLSGLAKGFTGA